MEICPHCQRDTPELIDCPWCSALLGCEPCMEKHDCPEHPGRLASDALAALECARPQEASDAVRLRRTFAALKVALDALEEYIAERDINETFRQIARLLKG